MANAIQGQMNPQQAGQAMAQPGAAAQPTGKKSIFKKWWFWLIVAVVLIIVGYLIWQLVK